MSRALALLLLAGVASTAPVPAEADQVDRVKRAFGPPADPDRDCTFTFGPSGLRLGLPEKPHEFRGRDPGNAPRTERRQAGDFVARVVVSCPPPLADAGTHWRSRVGGGLYAHGPEEGVRLMFGRMHWHRQTRDGGRWEESVLIDMNYRLPTGGEGGMTAGDKPPAGPVVHVRLTRTGDVLKFDFSADGKAWKELHADRYRLPRELTVGVSAENTTGKPAEVRFEGFTLEPADGK